MTKNMKGQLGKVIMNQMIEKLKDPRGVEKDLVIKQTGNKMSEKDYDNLDSACIKTTFLRVIQGPIRFRYLFSI
jgi:hypothetical protein